MSAKSYSERELKSLLHKAGYKKVKGSTKHFKYVKGEKTIVFARTPRSDRNYTYIALKVKKELEG